MRNDAVGNVWGRLAGTEAGPVVATGSHIDSQNPGGRYDGALGVIAGIVALRALREQFGEPRRTLEAVSLCEEEASRFHATNFWGSRAIVGAIGPDDAERIHDHDGLTIGEAMEAVGLDPGQIPKAARDDIGTWIELHIEQGPILEDEELPVGVVDAITVDHALRRRARRALRSRRRAADEGPPRPDGRVRGDRQRSRRRRAGERPAGGDDGRTRPRRAEPALGRPGQGDVHARLTAPRPARRRGAARRAGAADARDRRAPRPAGSPGRSRSTSPPARATRAWSRPSNGRRREQGIAYRRMHSGAGHDTQNMAKIARVAMVFARSKDGRSHTPEEFTSVEDAVAAIRVLAGALHELAY